MQSRMSCMLTKPTESCWGTSDSLSAGYAPRAASLASIAEVAEGLPQNAEKAVDAWLMAHQAEPELTKQCALVVDARSEKDRAEPEHVARECCWGTSPTASRQAMLREPLA